MLENRGTGRNGNGATNSTIKQFVGRQVQRLLVAYDGETKGSCCPICHQLMALKQSNVVNSLVFPGCLTHRACEAQFVANAIADELTVDGKTNGDCTAALCKLCTEAGCSKNDPECAVRHAITRLQQRLQDQAQEAAARKAADRKPSPRMKKVV
ncbi:MAG: hypothetical protein RB292_04125 [Patescibacteria group bacterium]|nr:hypothetical protein [Patescibacteria group bacterium]